MSLPDNPNTLRETYYSVMAGQNDASILPDIETAPSTENRYLDYIARNGGGGGGDVSGVKGDAEETYRTGNVNITAANVGAYTKTETDTLLNSKADTTDVDNVKIASTATNTSITLTESADANLQAITVKGRSEVISGEIVSVGDAGWGVVDLGTLSWTRGETQTSGVYDFYSYELSPLCISNNNTVNGICGKYNDTTIANIYNGTAADKSIAVSNNTIRIRNDNYTDATVFKSALSGVVLYYKLADTTGATPILGIVTNNGEGQGTAATITTGLPLRSTSDGTVYDELTNDKVITRCEVVEGEVVPLATPTETPLTSAEIAALAALQTYNSITHIDATDAPTMTVDYLLNTNNGQAVARIDDKTANKVDKVAGKGLSTEDYTTAEKTKLAGVQDNATANTVINTTVTLAANAWTGASAPYTQTVNVTGMLATDHATVDLSVSSTTATGIDEIENWAYISKVESGAGTLTFTCYEDKPDIDLNVNVQVVRGTGDYAFPDVKAYTYTGTGTTSQTITFPEKPFMILGYTEGADYGTWVRGIMPFVFHPSTAMLRIFWKGVSETSHSVDYQYNSAYVLTINGNSISWTGVDAAQALNSNGVEYTIYYI